MLAVKQLIPGRGRKLVALEREISPQPVSEGMDTDSEEQFIQNATIELINGIANGAEASQDLKDYFELCLEDAQIAKICEKRKLKFEHKVKIFRSLASAGLNRWIKGRNAALASFSDYTAFLFLVRAIRKGTDYHTISNELAGYWNGKIDPHKLLAQTSRDNTDAG